MAFRSSDIGELLAPALSIVERIGPEDKKVDAYLKVLEIWGKLVLAMVREEEREPWSRHWHVVRGGHIHHKD